MARPAALAVQLHGITIREIGIGDEFVVRVQFQLQGGAGIFRVKAQFHQVLAGKWAPANVFGQHICALPNATQWRWMAVTQLISPIAITCIQLLIRMSLACIMQKESV